MMGSAQNTILSEPDAGAENTRPALTNAEVTRMAEHIVDGAARTRKFAKDNAGQFIAEPAEVRFWRRVEKTDGCWWWTPASGRNLYGRFSVGHSAIGAHKFAWELHHDTVPDGLYVLHKCDNRNCVNPDHLFLGTHQDNVNDMVAKGRHRSGERHYKSKLSKAQADEIRRRYEAGEANQYELAEMFAVHQGTIHRVVARGYLKETR